MQRVLGYSAMKSGFGIVPFSLAGVVAGWCLRSSFARFSRRANMLGGLSLYLVGLLFFVTLSPGRPYLLHIAPGMALGGFGSIIGFLACLAASTADVPEEHQGAVSGLVYVSQKFGRAVGAAITLTILSIGSAHASDVFETYRLGYSFLTGAMVLALASIAFISPRTPGRSSPSL
jgi:Na+/melibiose symporter-like transporter